VNEKTSDLPWTSVPALVFPQCSGGKSAGAPERSAERSDEGRPLELFNRRGGGRLAGGCELLRRQLGLEPLERRTGGVGVGRGQLLVANREREEHGGPLLFGAFFRETRADPAQCEADPAQCEELQRDGLRTVGTLERVAKARARLGAVSDRQRREADAAERRDQSPAVVALGEGVVARASESQASE
jgi:hypothetical protein